MVRRSMNKMDPRPNKRLRLMGDTDSSSDEDSSMIVIGIDFGTTYSGAAWATGADFQAGQIHLITRWPGTGREEGKALTELFFEAGKVFWGYEVPADADPVRWFKLLLLKDEDLAPETRFSEYIIRGRKMLRENEKTAVELVADYLRGFWKHVLYEISKARGPSVIDGLRLHVVVTLPAIWKGYARQSMQEAIKQAGILDNRDAGDTTLSFVPEPEAAALSTLCEPGRIFSKGDVYIICDAGGGTVDLITYEIERVKPLAVREATEGTGGLCGGIFIDEAFERICKNRLGRIWDRLSKTGIREVMKGEWEHAIKPQFRISNSEKEYIVAIPAEVFPNQESQTDKSRQPFIKSGRIHFREADLQKAFPGVFSDIEKLIDGQISSGQKRGLSITGIVLVGGLGSSPYLYETLNSKYSKQRINVLQSSGIGPRTAIGRGAVYKGFLDQTARQAKLKVPITITSTISRAHFGIKYRTAFSMNTHLEEDKRWDSCEEVWNAENQMHWYIHKGQDVSQSQPVRKTWIKTSRTGFTEGARVDVYQCLNDTPPSRADSSVSYLCTVDWNSDAAILAKLEWKTNTSGVRYKKLFFELEFIPQGATVEIAVYVQGRKQNRDSHFNIQYAK